MKSLTLFFLFFMATASAQDIPPKKHSLGLYLGEASTITYTRQIKSNPNFRFCTGLGMMGLIYPPNYGGKYSNENGFSYNGRSGIIVSNLFVRYGFNVFKNKIGINAQTGLHSRILPWLQVTRHSSLIVFLDNPRKFTVEFIPFIQTGAYFRPGAGKYEFGFNLGIATDVYSTRTPYTEVLGDVYMAVRF